MHFEDNDLVNKTEKVNFQLSAHHFLPPKPSNIRRGTLISHDIRRKSHVCILDDLYPLLFKIYLYLYNNFNLPKAVLMVLFTCSEKDIVSPVTTLYINGV